MTYLKDFDIILLDQIGGSKNMKTYTRLTKDQKVYIQILLKQRLIRSSQDLTMDQWIKLSNTYTINFTSLISNYIQDIRFYDQKKVLYII